jgi:hypothetical protein
VPEPVVRGVNNVAHAVFDTQNSVTLPVEEMLQVIKPGSPSHDICRMYFRYWCVYTLWATSISRYSSHSSCSMHSLSNAKGISAMGALYRTSQHCERKTSAAFIQHKGHVRVLSKRTVLQCFVTRLVPRTPFSNLSHLH